MLVISHNYPIKVYNKSAYILKYKAKNSTVRGELFFHFVALYVLSNIKKYYTFIDGLIFGYIPTTK